MTFNGRPVDPDRLIHVCCYNYIGHSHWYPVSRGGVKNLNPESNTLRVKQGRIIKIILSAKKSDPPGVIEGMEVMLNDGNTVFLRSRAWSGCHVCDDDDVFFGYTVQEARKQLDEAQKEVPVS